MCSASDWPKKTEGLGILEVGYYGVAELLNGKFANCVVSLLFTFFCSYSMPGHWKQLSSEGQIISSLVCFHWHVVAGRHKS